MKLEDMSPELLKKVQACNSAEEIFELVKEEGLELAQEQLDMISGGDGKGNGWNQYHPCPQCNSDKATVIAGQNGKAWLQCLDCGHKFLVDWEGTLNING